MANLLLSQGKIAIVDDDDFLFLNKWKWSFSGSGGGYAVRRENKKTILLHRQIIGIPKENVDHINGNGLDNRKENLRLCTQKMNTKNASSHKDSRSKYKGVHWHSLGKGYWRARIMADGIARSLGLFKTEKEAAEAYNEAAIRLHGEYARLNIIHS